MQSSKSFLVQMIPLSVHCLFYDRLHMGALNRNERLLFACKKNRVSDIYKVFTSKDNFSICKDLIRTHSIRKLPITRWMGCSCDEVDAPGWWKNYRRIVDIYIVNTIPYPDVKVAAVLYVGEAMQY